MAVINPESKRGGMLDMRVDRDIDHYEAQKEKDGREKRKGRRST
jgi:hypothetical protein